MRRLAMITTVAAIAPLSVLGVALTAASWWEGITMAVGYLLTLGVLREWSLDGYPRRSIFALCFTAAAWGIGSLTAASPISFVPLSLVGALLIARTTRWRAGMIAFALAVAAIGATAFVFHPPTWLLAGSYLLVPFVGTLFIAAVIVVSEQAWWVVRRLERAKEAEAELAIAHERMRFAGDLHDIQGHSLHVIKLKAALAGHLVRTDPDRARCELAEIRRLADQTITETRELAYARRELNLAAEVENARRVAEAAGIEVRTSVDDAQLRSAHPLLAQVLREATTNLLRHARPTTVTITASCRAVTVTNDGVPESAPAELRGLARLRERVAEAGGELRVEHSPDRFTVSAHLDPITTDAAAGASR